MLVLVPLGEGFAGLGEMGTRFIVLVDVVVLVVVGSPRHRDRVVGVHSVCPIAPVVLLSFPVLSLTVAVSRAVILVTSSRVTHDYIHEEKQYK